MKRMMVVAVVALSVLFVAFGASAQEDAWIPGLASFVLPGLGQILNDQLDKAILHFGVDLAIVAVGYYVGTLIPFAYYTIPALHLGWAIYSGLDAYNVAKDQGFSIGFVETGVRLSYTF